MANTVIRSEVTEFEAAEQIIFACAYALTELLRTKRRSDTRKTRAPLLCENVLFIFPYLGDDEAVGKALLAWPHYVLKSKYTQLGILFGKFGKNAQEISREGRHLPVPPCHFISIRENVPAKDLQFFQKTDWLLPALESAQDDGRNVFEGAKVNQMVKDFCQAPTGHHLECFCNNLIKSDFYLQAKTAAAQELAAQRASKKASGG